jgi:DNA segregation ATPase FtsK/SpoIIIE-like protein
LVAWEPTEVPHLLVAGATGGGKGGLLRLIVHRTHASGWSVTILDPKGTGESRWAHEAGVPVVHDLDAQVDHLRRIAEEVAQRCRVTWAHGVDRVGALADGLRPAPVLVILDEAPDVLLLRKVPAEKEADELRSEAASLVSEIAAKGRAAAVHLILSIQRPDAAMLGALGGFLRANLAGRVLLGRGSAEAVEMMFGPGRGDLVPMLHGTPGRALVSGVRAGDVEPTLVQVAWLDAASLLPEGWQPDALVSSARSAQDAVGVAGTDALAVSHNNGAPRV